MSKTEETEEKEQGGRQYTEYEEIIKEVCQNNGLSFNRLLQEGKSCVRLEMFFSGYPKIVGLNHFPNLQVLCIIGQSGINKIEALNSCPKLKELWICETEVKKIENLECVPNLRRLYLYGNKISKIENLEHLHELDTLWLTNNNIEELEGLATLVTLKQLGLGNNLISRIGNGLNNLVKLENLELSGNRFHSFKDLTSLVKLPSLVELGLKAPIYNCNPVGQLCNYTTHVLFHLPNLNVLDGVDISAKSLKDLSESTVIKKKMYYNMKVKTIWRNFTESKNRLDGIKEQILEGPKKRLSALVFAIKDIERELRFLKQSEGDTETHESGTESDKDAREAQAAEDKSVMTGYNNKLRCLKERLKHWEKKWAEVQFYYHEVLERLRHGSESIVGRMLTELETGGNVRFEDGKQSDPWFTSCHDLVLSRFCGADYKEHGIVGIKINRITRVHNRMLRARFEEALSIEVDEDDSYYPSAKNNNYKKLLEYLFWVWDPDVPGGMTEPAQVLENGFMDAATYKQLGKDGAVPLSNSVSIADRHRMHHCSRYNKNKEYTITCPYRHGQLIVSKVYVGKSAQCNDKKQVDHSRFPKADSVFRPRADVPDKHIAKNALAEASRALCNPAKNVCECSSRQCEWFIFNNHLVLPEYVIDFEYITRLKNQSPFSVYEECLRDKKVPPPEVPHEQIVAEEEVIFMDPQVKQRPRLIQLTEEVMLKCAKMTSLSNIKVLNLHGNGLSKLKPLHHIPALRKLILSFNEMSRLDDLSGLPIEYLDASFNRITTLEGFKTMNKLKHLDLCWNKLTNTRDDISIMRKHCPTLVTLDVRHNNWQKPEGYRLRAIGRIKTLTKLNGAPVTEAEATAALRMAAGSRISQVSLLAHSRTDQKSPRTLNLSSVAQVLSATSRHKPDRVGEQDNLWYLKVTTLNLDSQHISKLSNLDRLENLKWASFNDNDITKIEGLENCLNLEELSLEHNCISRLENIHHLPKLRRLCMGHNYILSLDNTGLERLSQLQYFSIESNILTSLLGLQRATSLVELYVGNNTIDNVREVFYLKSLTNLVILDLYGNPVSGSSDNYRLFVIYHLKCLKALDGVAIESGEGGQAKDAFGGRLTQDFVAERMGSGNFNEMRELDFPQASIRTVDLGMGEIFTNLRSVNLEHNNLTSFSGLVYLTNLRVLCLNHNHIECIVPRTKQSAQSLQKYAKVSQTSSVFQPDSSTPLLENLEVLHLGYNGIKDMSTLQLSRLPSLKALFLQGNEIAKVEGLEGLQDLRELVLDRNKIKGLSEYSFVNQWNLQELHLEENRVRDLTNFGCLENLQRLFLGMNRIQDLNELEKLDPLTNLVEFSVVSNAIARRMLHRPLLIFRIPSLMVIDGIPVSEEERAKADMYFMDQQPPPMTTTVETTLPGIGQYKAQIPVKVTNMQLVSGPYYDKNWSGPVHYSEDAIQQELQRVGANKKRAASDQQTRAQGGQQAGGKMTGTMAYQHAPALYGSSTGGSKSQHQMSNVPYVPYQAQNNEGNDNRMGKGGRR